MKWPFYISCALNGILAGVLLSVCGGVASVGVRQQKRQVVRWPVYEQYAVEIQECRKGNPAHTQSIYAANVSGVLLSVFGRGGTVDGEQGYWPKLPSDHAPRSQGATWETVGGSPAQAQTIYTAPDLLWRAESSNGLDLGPSDGGKAYGHFGQHAGPQEHWDIGCRALGVNWPESDRANLARAAAITAANWAKCAPEALKSSNVEMLIRKHRLPNAPMRADNDAYLERVMR